MLYIIQCLCVASIHKETFKINRQLIWITSFQGYRLSERFYGILIKKFDRSGKGVVNFDDFIQCCVVIQVSNRYEVLLHGWLSELPRISIWWSNQSLDQLDHILIYSPYTELLWSFSLKNKSRKRKTFVNLVCIVEKFVGKTFCSCNKPLIDLTCWSLRLLLDWGFFSL